MPGPAGPFGARSNGTLRGFNGAPAGQTLLFSADDGVHGSELWRTDGAPGSATMVQDILPGAASSSPSHLMTRGGSVLFWADWAGTGSDPWISDGTTAGTGLVRPLSPAGVPQAVSEMDGAVYFLVSRNLFATDGTYAGTRFVYSFSGTVTISGVCAGHLLLTAADNSTGTELWISDGMGSGTHLLKDIAPGSASSGPYNLVSAGGRIFFTANDGVHGRELWTSDLTETGTSMILDLRPGSASGSYYLYQAPGAFCFIASDGVASRVWTSDGTAAGTRPIRELRSYGNESGISPTGRSCSPVSTSSTATSSGDRMVPRPAPSSSRTSIRSSGRTTRIPAFWGGSRYQEREIACSSRPATTTTAGSFG